MNQRKILFLVSVFILSRVPVLCADTYAIDPGHSSVSFKIRHVVGNVRGSFKGLKGTIEFNEADPSASAVRVRIDTAGVDTGIGKRDDHLRSADFFDAAKYPEITFISKKVDAKNSQLIGDLTMHGVTREVVLDYTYAGLAQNKKGETVIGGSGQTRLNRRDFGIHYDPSGLTVGNDVAVDLDIEAVKKG